MTVSFNERRLQPLDGRPRTAPAVAASERAQAAAAGLLAELADLHAQIADLEDAASERGSESDVQPVLLTIEEAARSLRIGRSMAWQLVKNGDLRSVKIGASRRIPVSALAEFTNCLRTSSTACRPRGASG
jgi:excisionase family DNA binding protein